MTGLIDAIVSMAASPLMQRSLIAALLVGMAGPVVGTYLVHRRLAMLGDGIGHVSLTGVALGWLAGTAANITPKDAWALPGALLVSLLGAVVIELVRQSGRTSADVALAMLFYGGIAGGVLLIGIAGGTSAQLNSYLFGSIATVSWNDILLIAVLALAILIIGVGIAPGLFSVTNDEEFARSTGLPVKALSMIIAVLSALTVAVAMRVVGSLLVSALMVIPVAIAQLGAKSFTTTMRLAMGIGAFVCLAGLSLTYFIDLSPGAAIVVLAIGIYALAFLIRTLVDSKQRNRRMRAVVSEAPHPERRSPQDIGYSATSI
ncbi:metal ABC transporter permease [Schaalia hyovaginalis]|uniref:Zinc transport system permease protein n=1 Tax=Schaalia hyovaginalis TaxID=29316 RepID=A0A923IZ62_9ACTO|nr:metal ABC transporter permease [Schaalia hyovaginalis]MBB6334369.1 zinc transport system permease protein [Schaalia hyovaginalis]